MDAGLIGGIVGSAIGVLGGAVGTYASIKNVSGPRERAFMVQVAVVAWIAISAFVLGLLMLPRPYNFLLWVPYAAALTFGLILCNRRQRRIRDEESVTGSVGPKSH